jgi:tetratricopeptide (TPR) repeat protein
MKNKGLRNVLWLIIASVTLMPVLPQYCFSQGNEKSFYHFAEPEFYWGHDGFAEYNSEHLDIKHQDFRFEIQGSLVVIFTLGKDKLIKNLKVTDSTSSPDLNKKLMEWIKIGQSNWSTAKVNNQPVDVNIIITIKPHLDERGTTYYLLCGYNMLIDPVLATAFYNTGADAAANENFSEAIKYFNETLGISPRDIDALYNRGICKYKSGDKSGACTDWQEIKRIGKGDADKLLLKYCSQ